MNQKLRMKENKEDKFFILPNKKVYAIEHLELRVKHSHVEKNKY